MPDTDTAARRVRAFRILDAAAILINQWGYNKTNIEDIAKAAGVGKGTIYLHWKTRDDLFRALINRERLTMALDFRQQMRDETGGATLYTIYRHYAYALMKRPLLKALILRDTDIMGKFADLERSTAAFAERSAGFKVYLEFLRGHGLVRTDASVAEQVYMLGAIVMGFYFIEPMMPPDLRLSEEAMADLLAKAVQNALESGFTPSEDALRTISQTFLDYLNHAIELAEAQFYGELDALPAGRE